MRAATIMAAPIIRDIDITASFHALKRTRRQLTSTFSTQSKIVPGRASKDSLNALLKLVEWVTLSLAGYRCIQVDTVTAKTIIRPHPFTQDDSLRLRIGLVDRPLRTLPETPSSLLAVFVHPASDKLS